MENTNATTVEPRRMTREELLVDFLPAAIRTLRSRSEKATCMTMLGDARYDQFKQTGNRDYLRLAKNCYLAARNFQR